MKCINKNVFVYLPVKLTEAGVLAAAGPGL
jgi:hypothetical protein